ncbi:MAG: hypothetical protein IJ714_07240 [Bacteroidales bacterium]|nr:hypothetical protein [Bacteroidales bacterium]
MRKLIALMVAVFMMAAVTVVPSFAARDISVWLEKNVTVGADDPANINARNKTGIRTVKKVYQTFRYTQEAHPISGQGCFSITKGVLKDGGKSGDIYLIASHGLEGSAFGQKDDLTSCLAARLEQSSAYLKQFIKIVKANVPKDANIILAGHSLGGMISQQAAADKGMQKRYNILHVITWGSPLLCMGQIEGQLHRNCAAGDVVPLLSIYTLEDSGAQLKDRNREKADVIPVIQSHVEGYNDKNAWKDYDALGVKGGKAVLKMDDSTTQRFNAPKGKGESGVAWVAFNNNGNWTGISVLY